MNITSDLQSNGLGRTFPLQSALPPEPVEKAELLAHEPELSSAMVFSTDTDAPLGRLTLEAFSQLAGNPAGHPFVKVVVDRTKGSIHFIHHARYSFHADYIGQVLLGMSKPEIEAEIDEFN